MADETTDRDELEPEVLDEESAPEADDPAAGFPILHTKVRLSE